MAITMNVTVLDVGQGMGNFVEIYDDTKTPSLISTLLFDLGSDNYKKQAGEPSVDYIVNKLKTMTNPTIDLLVLSHSDSDHVNLIPYLLSKFTPTTTTLPSLKINKVYYGANRAWYPCYRDLKTTVKTKINVLTMLEGYIPSPSKVIPFTPAEGGLNKDTKKWTPFYDKGNGVTVSLLAANVPDEPPPSKRRKLNSGTPTPNKNSTNTMSAVCKIEYKNNAFIIAGDATYNTLCRINTIFNGTSNLFDNVKMLTQPHHGSRKTTFGLNATNAKISDVQKQGVKAFVDLIKAQSLAVSADRKHKHPSLETIDEFSTSVSKSSPWYIDTVNFPAPQSLHSMTTQLDLTLVYPDTKTINKKDYSFQTQANIYSTLYSININDRSFSYSAFSSADLNVTLLYATAPTTYPLLPTGVSWCYSVSATGVLTLSPIENRAGVTASSASVLSASFESPASAQNKTEAQQPAQPASPKLSSIAPRPAIASRAPTLSRLKALR